MDVRGIGEAYIQILGQASEAYTPLVDDLCRRPDASENEVGLMLDYLLSFCDSPEVLEMYKRVCRTFYNKYPESIARYVQWYREEYEADE